MLLGRGQLIHTLALVVSVFLGLSTPRNLTSRFSYPYHIRIHSFTSVASRHYHLVAGGGQINRYGRLTSTGKHDCSGMRMQLDWRITSPALIAKLYFKFGWPALGQPHSLALLLKADFKSHCSLAPFCAGFLLLLSKDL